MSGCEGRKRKREMGEGAMRKGRRGGVEEEGERKSHFIHKVWL